MGRRRKYTPQYRRDVASLVIDTGATIAQIARDLDVGQTLLGKWVAAEREQRLADSRGTKTDSQLAAENARLRTEVEFLEKASAFFASKRRNESFLN